MTLNKTTKGLSFAIAMFAIAGMMVAFNNQEAYARPAPDAPVGDHVMKINLIGVPNATDRNCDNGSSNNIYTPRGTDVDGVKIKDNIKHQHILWNHASPNSVVDHCTEGVGISADEAIVQLEPGNYKVSIRILGPANDVSKNFLKICSETVSSHLDDEISHCVIEDMEIIDQVNRNSGKPTSTVLPKNLFDDSVEGQVWSTTNGGLFRIAQIDIWELPPA